MEKQFSFLHTTTSRYKIGTDLKKVLFAITFTGKEISIEIKEFDLLFQIRKSQLTLNSEEIIAEIF